MTFLTRLKKQSSACAPRSNRPYPVQKVHQTTSLAVLDSANESRQDWDLLSPWMMISIPLAHWLTFLSWCGLSTRLARMVRPMPSLKAAQVLAKKLTGVLGLHLRKLQEVEIRQLMYLSIC